ncbi:unnamed protein product [Heterosigma akashiwo]
MSDSNYAVVSNYQDALEEIGYEWEGDVLSDDEIELPPDIDAPLENDLDAEGAFAAAAAPPPEEERKWADTGLDFLSPRHERAAAAAAERGGQQGNHGGGLQYPPTN